MGLISGVTNIARMVCRKRMCALSTKYKILQQYHEKKWIRDTKGFQLGSMADIISVTKNHICKCSTFGLFPKLYPLTGSSILGLSDSSACSFETLCHLF